MTKNDMLDLIVAAKDIEKVCKFLEEMCGATPDNVEGINRVFDVIRRYANEEYGYADDSEKDEAHYTKLLTLMRSDLRVDKIYDLIL
ncbi:MAG: hypothetical protein PUC12_03645 [Clostridiales bacterium]|nr:hypothetical protein [Clostridiales bacterium]